MSMFGLDQHKKTSSTKKKNKKLSKMFSSHKTSNEEEESTSMTKTNEQKIPPPASPASVMTSSLQRSASQRPSRPHTSSMTASSFEWIDARGRTTSPPPPPSTMKEESRVVELELAPNSGLGVTLRGGSQHGLGIYVSAIEASSCAVGSLRVGDQILAFNGNPWVKNSSNAQSHLISLEEAVRQVVRATSSCARPVLCFRIRSTGKVPSATLVRTTSFSGGIDNNARKKSLIPSSRCEDPLRSSRSPAKSSSSDLIGSSRDQELTEANSTFEFFENEYRRGRLPAQSLGNFLRQFCDRSDVRAGLVSHVMERVLLPRDVDAFLRGFSAVASDPPSVSPDQGKQGMVFLEVNEGLKKRRLSSSASCLSSRRCSSLHLPSARTKRLLPGIPSGMTSSDLTLSLPSNPRRRESTFSTTSSVTSSLKKKKKLPCIPVATVVVDDHDLDGRDRLLDDHEDHDQRRHSSFAPTSLLLVPNINVRRSSVDVEASSEEEDSTRLPLLMPPPTTSRRGSGNHLTIPGSAPLYLSLPQTTKKADSGRVVRRHRSLPSPFIHHFSQQTFGANFDSGVKVEERDEGLVAPTAKSSARCSSFRRPHHRTTIESGGRLRILIKKSRPFLGIAIEGGSDVAGQSLPRIISIMGSGSAFETSDLHVGHIILEVDNISTVGLTHAQVAQMMADAFYRTPHKDFIEILVREKKKHEFDIRTSSFMLLNRSFE